MSEAERKKIERQEHGMNQQTTTRITQVHTVGVPVTDQERALDFYVGKLGFEKRMDASFGAGQRWLEVHRQGR